MKLGGLLTQSQGYPIDDPPVIVYAALRACMATCERYSVEPVGTFEMATVSTWDGSDKGVCWEFVPRADEP